MDPAPRRRRRARARGPSTYVCGWYDRYEAFFAIVVLLPATVVGTIAFVAAGASEGIPWVVAIDVAVIVYVAHVTLYLPSKVVLDGEGVRLTSRARRVFVPWAELVDVTHSPAAWRFPGRLRWGRAHGRAVRTPAEFPDLIPLLDDVQRRAPHVTIYA
jgi:hypothetical protein